MKHLFIDANVVLDLLTGRTPFFEAAAELFEAAYNDRIVLYVSTLTFNNVYYVMSKAIGPKAANSRLKDLYDLVTVLDVTKEVVDHALRSGNVDFEDAVQYYAGISYKKVQAIITRDKKGFKNSDLPVFTPSEILGLI